MRLYNKIPLPKKTKTLTKYEKGLLCLPDGRRIYKFICKCAECHKEFGSDFPQASHCAYKECKIKRCINSR